jgi:hypothetical protein
MRFRRRCNRPTGELFPGSDFRFESLRDLDVIHHFVKGLLVRTLLYIIYVLFVKNGDCYSLLGF